MVCGIGYIVDEASFNLPGYRNWRDRHILSSRRVSSLDGRVVYITGCLG